jgi:hypothetical protein
MRAYHALARRTGRIVALTVAANLVSACTSAPASIDSGPETDDVGAPGTCLPLPAFADVWSCPGALGPACRPPAEIAPATDVRSGDYFMPIQVRTGASGGTALVDGVAIFDAGSGDGVPPPSDGSWYDYPTWTAAARVTYEVRLDSALPMAALIRAEPIALDAALTEYNAGRLERAGRPRVLCEQIVGWDVWTMPATTEPRWNHSPGAPWFPISFHSVQLVDRSAGAVWRVSLPVVPAACLDPWMGTAAGDACEPTLGIARRTEPTVAHAFAFFGQPWTTETQALLESMRTTRPDYFSCPLQPTCCPGQTPDPSFCPHAVDEAWLDVACTASTLDLIPIPTVPPCMTPTDVCVGDWGAPPCP